MGIPIFGKFESKTADGILLDAGAVGGLDDAIGSKAGSGIKYVEADGNIYLVNSKGEILGEGIPMPKNGVGIIDIKLSEV